MAFCSGVTGRGALLEQPTQHNRLATDETAKMFLLQLNARETLQATFTFTRFCLIRVRFNLATILLA